MATTSDHTAAEQRAHRRQKAMELPESAFGFVSEKLIVQIVNTIFLIRDLSGDIAQHALCVAARTVCEYQEM